MKKQNAHHCHDNINLFINKINLEKFEKEYERKRMYNNVKKEQNMIKRKRESVCKT